MTYIFLFCVYFWLSLSNWILQSFDHVFSHPFWRKWIKMSWTKLMVVFVGGKVTESYYHTWHASREFRRDKNPELDLKLGEQCKRVNVFYCVTLLSAKMGRHANRLPENRTNHSLRSRSVNGLSWRILRFLVVQRFSSSERSIQALMLSWWISCQHKYIECQALILISCIVLKYGFVESSWRWWMGDDWWLVSSRCVARWALSITVI